MSPPFAARMRFLKKFRESRGVDAVFYGIRPASTALIAAALAEVCSIALMFHEVTLPENQALPCPLS